MDNLLIPRQTQDPNCISCPAPSPCNCGTNEDCVQYNRDCHRCPSTTCVPRPTNPSSSAGGISKGALAGAIIGSIAFLSLAIAFFLRHRKKSLIRRNSAAKREVKDVPASAETVLNRPDPLEKPPSTRSSVLGFSSAEGTSATSGNIDFPLPPPINPFDDTHSIQTTRTEGTNVIPIALVPPPDSHRASVSHSDASSSSAGSNGPMRPPRSPDLNLNLEHVNVSNDNVRTGGAYSMRSGISSRNSYMSSASYSSDFLNEAPMIVTPAKGAVRQVLGVVKAEVISAGSLGSPDLKPPPAYSKPAVKSPLAASSFGPNDLIREDSESQHTADPFADENSSTKASYSPAASPSATTFRHLSTQPSADANAPQWATLDPGKWATKSEDHPSRPSSMATQAGSVIDIASATRVNVGLKTPGSGNSYRTTMGRLVSPLEEQQQRALAHAQMQAQAQGLEKRRISGSSVLSATSTRADSILESFPFVPPSPISDRPIRSPPVSPLAQQSFTTGSHSVVVAPPSPRTPQTFSPAATRTTFGGESSPLAPPDRRLLGMSTGSQLSTASSGLGSFPFQIETEPTDAHPPPPAYDRRRASLDTLALTSDLSSYPLHFDRDSQLPPLPKK